MKSIVKSNFGPAVLCLVAAYVALLPQFYLIYDIGNRYTSGWSPQHRASILMAIGILAAAYFLLYAALQGGARLIAKVQRRIDARRLVFDLAIWILAALVLRSAMAIAYATEQMPSAVTRLVDSPSFKLICYLLLPAGLLWFRRNAFEKAILRLYQLGAILFALFFAQLFVWDFYSTEMTVDSIPADYGKGSEANSLYIFLFDEWSYDHSFGNPEFDLSEMPRLQELLRQATLFRNAYSPSVLTAVSIPRFLFQTDKRIFDFSLNDLEWGLQHNDFLPLGLNSIFDLSDSHYKHLSGFYLHYPNIIGDHVDSLIPFYDMNRRYSLKERVLVLLYSQLGFLSKFGIDIDPPVRQFGWTGEEYQARIRPVLNDLLPRLPSRNISFFHMNLPHAPFRVRRDWTPLDHPAMGEETSNLTVYLENVYAMDAVFGDIMDLLRARGDYDSSMLVFLSDHSWKKSFGCDHEGWAALDLQGHVPAKHVPLIIKYPGQTRGGESDTPIGTAELHPLFKAYLTSPDQMARWVSRWNAGTETNSLYDPE